MAKGTTKTQRKEVASSVEPKVMGLTGWTGINIKDNPLEWLYDTTDQFNNTNASNKVFIVQNNLDTTSSTDVAARQDTQHIAVAPEGVTFTGISCLCDSMLYCAFSDETIRVHDVMSEDLASWDEVIAVDVDGSEATSNPWTCLNIYERTFIAFRQDPEIYTGELNETNDLGHEWCSYISSAKYVPNPTTAPTLSVRGILTEQNTDYVTRISITYAYSNRFGSTLDFGSTPVSGARGDEDDPDTENYPDWPTICVDASPAEFSAHKYIRIEGSLVDDLGEDWASYGVTGIDLYERQDENSDAIFIGHVDIQSNGSWYYNWLGAMSDTSVWTDVPLTIPYENTTKGVHACYFSMHDGRLYFWGGDEKYRLWIGGNPGNELSIATGTGGAYVDIEPGSGIEVKGTEKFKTYNGASIVTIMCGNPNSGKVKRYNLIETNLTVTSEISTKSYSTEEVANVVGSNSIYGFGSFFDGLYAVNRYGLLVTTAVMESNNQLRVNNMSEAVQPIFTDKIASRLANARLVYIDEVIYILFGDEDDSDLDNMILCYDTQIKAWYTYTYDEDVPIKHMFNFDYMERDEGLGIITADKIDLIPVTGEQALTAPVFRTYLETPDLSAKMPAQNYSYLDQLQFYFDYFIGEADIIIEGLDYYGRHITVEKHIKEDVGVYNYKVWMKICYIMQSWHIKIKGYARYRMTHILFYLYTESAQISQYLGYDTHSWYYNRHSEQQDTHHTIKSYNNLKEAIVT